MSLEQKRAVEKMNVILGRIKDAKGYNSEAISDFEESYEGVRKATAKAKVNARRKGAPRSIKETMDAAYEGEMATVKQLRKVVEMTMEDNQKLEQRIAELEQDAMHVDRVRKSFQYDASGNLRKWTPEAQAALAAADTSNEQVNEWKRTHDDMVLLGAFSDFARRYGKRQLNDITKTKMYAKYEAQTRALYSTGSTAGDELVPTVFSSQIHDLYQMERKVAAAIPTVTMPSNPWHMPTVTANQTIYILGEKTSNDAANIKASNPTTGSSTLTAVKLGSRTVWSGELEEDSIVAVSGMVTNAFVKAYAKALENAIINGQSSGAIDTGLTILSDDELNAWDGFRKNTNTAQKVDISSTTDAKILGMLATMGEYGVDKQNLILIPSTLAYLKYIVGSDNFASWEKLGGPGSNVTGTVGRFYGALVIPSGLVRTDLNASGVYDGSTTTKTKIVAANVGEYLIGERRGFTTKVMEDIQTDQIIMVCTGRHCLNKLAASAATTEAYGYNIS